MDIRQHQGQESEHQRDKARRTILVDFDRFRSIGVSSECLYDLYNDTVCNYANFCWLLCSTAHAMTLTRTGWEQTRSLPGRLAITTQLECPPNPTRPSLFWFMPPHYYSVSVLFGEVERAGGLNSSELITLVGNVGQMAPHRCGDRRDRKTEREETYDHDLPQWRFLWADTFSSWRRMRLKVP